MTRREAKRNKGTECLHGIGKKKKTITCKKFDIKF